MKPPVLYLFVGYPGAGKTTVAKIIEQQTGAVHLWADHIRRHLFPQPTHSRTESKQLYDKLNIETEELLAEGKSVIFDTNFNFFDDRQLLREIAARHHAETVLIWVNTPREVAKQRAVFSDETRNGYDKTILEADFERMAGNLETPDDGEQPVKIDGTKIETPEQIAHVRQLLKL